MSNHYVGNRYVPKILRDDDLWSNEKEYEALTVVPWQGNSFTSRQFVPKGVDILNKDYWACTGNYSAQVEQYRQETQNAVTNVNTKLDNFSMTQDGKFEIMLNNYKKDINAYADGKYNDINTEINTINTNLTNAESAINSSMTAYEDQLKQTVDGYTTTANAQIERVEQTLVALDIVYDEGTSTDPTSDDVTIIEEGVE
jgi:hypothetical protein